jgi:hypothetical protein
MLNARARDFHPAGTLMEKIDRLNRALHNPTRAHFCGALFTLLLLAVAQHALAQPSSIKVRKGDQIDFTVRAEVEVTEILGDSERTFRAQADGPARLTVERITRGNIRWTYSTPELRLDSSAARLMSIDSVHALAVRFSTDRRGNVSGSGRRLRDLAPLMESVHRSILFLWFQPGIFRKMRPGATWTENRSESIVLEGLGIDAQAKFAVRYSFDGMADTLGVRAIRLRWSAPTMAIRGTRVIDGHSHPLQGDGEHSGIAYFSTIDGLLLAGVTESIVDMRIPSEGRGGAMPTMWRLHSASIRR